MSTDEIMKLADAYAERAASDGEFFSLYAEPRERSQKARAALLKAVEALAVDAARYRWLRDVGDSTWVPLKKRWLGLDNQCEAYIDAATQKETP